MPAALPRSKATSIRKRQVQYYLTNLVEERNKYAQKKLEEQRERERQAKPKARSGQRSTVVATIEKSLTIYFNDYLASCKDALQKAYNDITLESFVDKSLFIDEYSTYYPREHFDKFTTSVSVLYIGRDEVPNLKAKVVTVDKFETFSGRSNLRTPSSSRT